MISLRRAPLPEGRFPGGRFDRERIRGADFRIGPYQPLQKILQL